VIIQIIYTVVTLMAFAVILLTVHIRIGDLERRLTALQRRFDNSTASYGWTPEKKARMWAASQEDDHD